MSIPAYSNACLAPDSTGLNVYLVGVPTSNEGRLEMYSVSLSNINSPTATFVTNYTDSSFWSSSAPKFCLAYAGSPNTINSPIMVYQLGPRSYATNMFPNGTVERAGNFNGIGFVSNKLFSFTGAVNNLDWATGFANTTFQGTGSSWTGARFNASHITDSSLDWDLSIFPSQTPLLSVGTYVASDNTPAQGYHVVFDQNGAGMIYTALSTATLISETPTDRVQTLSSPQKVDMSGYSLSKLAVPVTMLGVGYILDRAPDGSTMLYSIAPSQSAKLQFVPVSGNVPSFSSNMAAAAVGSKIVIYGTSNNGAISFNSFDPVTSSWTGPGLVKAYNPPSQTSNPLSSSQGSKTNVAAIAGGVVGGLVVIALVAFLFFRSRRNSRTTQANAPPAYQDPGKVPNPASVPLMDQDYTQQQQIQQVQMQQQYNPHQSYIPQTQSTYTSQPIPVQQQASPVFFQPQSQLQPLPQESYSYVPPTSVPQLQQQPMIFQPQTSETNPQSNYGQVSYATPQTPASQFNVPTGQQHTSANQPHTPTDLYYTSQPANPQYIDPSSHYAA
ncbi:hypothetical protein BGX21_002126 [Mortierella sp. AD011]|nr:hypothetical protein BGX20_002068 [Mortierella sp. AD010]KAF9381339.1 hypothetical protein BGX21_002126 [Mortierella sp. AD011]